MFLAFHNVNAKAIEELNSEEIEEIVGESVSVSKTLSERIELHSDGICVICEEIKNEIEKNFNNKNIEITEDVEIGVYGMDDFYLINQTINEAFVSISVDTGRGFQETIFMKYIKVHYAKEEGYSEENENYILNKIKNIEYDFIEFTNDGMINCFLVENLGKGDNNIGEQVVLRKLKEQLNDNSIKVEYREESIDDIKDVKSAYLFFYKDNVLYDVKRINIASYYMNQISSVGTPIGLSRNCLIPDTLQREINTRGYENIIENYSVYLLSDYVDLRQDVVSPILLHVDTDYNNQKVKIVYFNYDFDHNVNYDEVEWFDGIVENGVVNVQISEKKIDGYFLIMLDNEIQTNDVSQKEDNEVQTNDVSQKEEIENPQTGSFVSYLVIVGGIVLAVVIFIISRKNTKLYKI